MIYHHPLAYLIGMEGLALLRAWAGDYDETFVTARLAEVRALLDDETLAHHPGVLVESGATSVAYRQWSATYDVAGNGLFDLDEPVLDEIIDTLPTGIAVDAACGTGRLASRLLQRGHHVIGVDNSVEMLGHARVRLPTTALLVGDLHRLPLLNDHVDLVVCGLALTHAADLELVFTEFARVLRPGGHLLISDVHHELALRGSVPKAVGPQGQAQLAACHRHTVGDYLRAGLATGFSVRRCEEQPPRSPPGPQEQQSVKAPLPRPDFGTWQQWPWTLLDLVPEATRAAWDNPSVIIWHFKLN